MSQATVQFGNVPVGSTTQPQTLTFTNPVGSSSSVTISNLTITGAGFSLVQTPTLPIIVAAGQSASIQVQALASAAGALTGTITITSNATPATSTINLLATGVSGPSQTLSGTITPASLGVGATITLTDASGKTADVVTADSNGTYTLFVFVNGSYTVTPTSSGIFFTSTTVQPITVTVGNSAQTVNFTASTTAPNPVPSIASFSPASLTVGAGVQTVTINGSGFVSGSTVTFNGSAHAATFVNATQLTIQLTAADLSTVGTFPVVVTNPAPGGGASAAVNFTIGNPRPTITTLSPASLSLGSAAQTLTINGSGFASGSTVTYNGVAHAAAFVSASQLTIQLSATDLATAGNFPVMVTNPAPGGGTSSAVNFTVGNPVPAISSLSPASLNLGSAAQTLSINGSNFLSTSTVTYNGVAHTGAFVSAGQLTIQLSATDLATGGTFAVIVTNPAPGGGASPAVNFIVTNPTPAVTSLSPSSLQAGSAAQTLTINGSNFVTTSTVTYNGVAHQATFVNASQLTIQLTLADVASGGNFALIVTNPAPGGGSSASVNFVVNNLVPSVTSLSPSSLPAGSLAKTLTINGSNFVATSTVTYNGVAHAATFVNAGQLTIQLTAADVSVPGSFAVIVTSPAPGGGASTAVNFTVSNPIPVITTLSPASLTPGSAAQTLTINGSGFVSGSTVTYNGVAHAATFVSASQLTIQLTAADLTTAGNFPVIVTNPAPGGGASSAVNFIVGNPVPAITSLSPASLNLGSAAQTLTINGSNFLSTSTVTYNGVAHAATFVSASQLTIQLSTTDLATAGNFPVIVTNPAPGGGASSAMNLAVGNPIPAITSLSPASLNLGSAAQPLTISGSNFLSTSTATYNGVAHATTFVSASQLTIQLTLADLASGGNFAVVVTNPAPGGGSSALVNFAVNNPVPSITSFAPTSLTVGASAQTLTVNGSGFVSGSTVTFNGIPHAATLVSATKLTIQLTAADLSTVGAFPIVATNPIPGGGASTAVNFTVGNPTPVITTLSPASLTSGSAAQTLTINGSGFVSGSTVTYNGVAHAATFVSVSRLTIQLSAPDLATVGNFPVIVTNPAPGGGASNSLNFPVSNPVPAISSLSPTSLAIGTTGPQTLTINGSNFVAASTVTYNGVSHAATLVNGGQLTIQLSTADLATAGTFPVIVTNPAPGGGISLSINFVVVGLSMTPGNLTFGLVDDGTSSTGQNGTLTAVGGAVTVNAPTVTGAGFSVTGVTFPLTLTAGQSTPFTVTFSPAAGSPGAVAGNAQFTSTVNTVAQTFSGTGARNVLLTWGASSTSGVTYNVYRCTGSCASPLSGFTQINTGISALTYTDNDPALVSGTTYFYTVTAALTGVESAPSNVASATVP